MLNSKALKKIGILTLTGISALSLHQCKESSQGKANDKNSAQSTAPAEDENNIVITFTYGSEKKAWIKQATDTFNAAKHKNSNGRVIHIHQVPMGSGECIDEILNGERQPHIISPASEIFIKLGNAKSQASNNEELIKRTKKLCLSPVVIAMWKPMAEALGYGKKPIGWEEILNITKNPKGWAEYGMPQWGKFRFGHTHPDYSNSGIISLIAETYAGAKKTAQLTREDIAKPEVGQYLAGIEQAIVHYGKSTGFFGKKMFANGPGYLSAAVLYENMVIEANKSKKLNTPVVAIYPKEGTFWSDHPIGIINRKWVDEEHQDAAQQYIDFLLSTPQQQAAMQFGFRSADIKIKKTANFSEINGVDWNQPKAVLEVPSVAVIEDIRKLWRKHKKKSHIVLAIDTSGSMNKNNKIGAARKGAIEMIKQLGDRDRLSIIAFSGSTIWVTKDQKVGPNRSKLEGYINSLFAKGRTQLYKSVKKSFDYTQIMPDREKMITAVVVLSDGQDTASKITLEQLIATINSDSEDTGTRVFTIAYGDGASPKELKKIADSTKGKHFKASTANIKAIFRDISTFF